MAKLSKRHIEPGSLSINVWMLGTESQNELETRRIVIPFILTAFDVIRVSMAERMPKKAVRCITLRFANASIGFFMVRTGGKHHQNRGHVTHWRLHCRTVDE
jgi:hypothetical protein